MAVAPAVQPANKEKPLLRVVLLHDKTGRIQVILAEQSMLDLKSITEQTGRDLVCVNQLQLDELCQSSRLSTLAPMPWFSKATSLHSDSVPQAVLHFQ